MGAPDDWLYEYALVRYMPRADRGESVNIGLVMMNKRRKWIRGMIRLDDKKILALNPDADLEFLKRQSRLFEKDDVPEKDLPVEEKYRWLTAVKSACIRVSPSHPGIVSNNIADQAAKDLEETITPADIMDLEFDRLFKALVM